MTMKKIKGTVTESLTVQKEVEVSVPDGATKEEMEAAIRAKAYEKNILMGDHGWEGVETSGVEISVEGEVKAAYPDGRCPDCGFLIADSVDEGEECSNCGHVFHLERQNDISIEGEGEGEVEGECKRCGTNLDKDGYCKDETCPHSDYLQTETWVEG